MAVGRNYELKARFSAEVDSSVNKAFSGMHTRLNNLEKKIEKVDKKDVNVNFDERGATEMEARLERLEKKLDSLDRKKSEPKVGMDTSEFERKIRKLDVQADHVVNQVRELKFAAKTDVALKQAQALGRRVSAITDRYYDLRVRVKSEGTAAEMAELEELERKISDISGETIRIRTSFDNAGFSKMTLAIADATKGLGSFNRYIQGASRWGQVLQNFGQLATAAFIGLAAAASGPLLSGLTILGGAVFSVVTGFGLIALAAAPIISAFANQKENATALKSAQDSLASSTDALKSAQNGLKDAVDGVAEARRSGAESVRSALESERQAAIGVQTAQDSYQNSHEASADAAEELDDATSSLNDALATEKMRLASMRNDLQGMKLSQEELGFEISQTEKELSKGNLTMEERRDAEFRLQELELQRKQNTIDIKMAQRDLTKAEKEGTTELKSAIETRKDAKNGVDEAKQAEIAAGKAVKEALRGQRMAAQETATARKDASRQVDEALDAVAEAEKAVSEAAKKVKSDQQAVNAILAKTPKYMKPIMDQVNKFKTDYADSFHLANVQTANFGAELVHVARQMLPMLGVAAFRTVRRVQNAFHQLGRESIKFGALESFQRILRSVPGITAMWTKAFGRFSAAFINIMGQAVPYVRRFSRWVADIALKFLKWTDSEKGRKQIHKFFEAAAPLAKDLWKWTMRIAGAILHWSINHPKELAHVLDMIGTLLFGIVRLGMAFMNIIFRISKTEHRWRNLALFIIGIRVALTAVGLAMRGLVYLVGRGLVSMGRMFVQMGKNILGPLKQTFTLVANLIRALLIRGILTRWKETLRVMWSAAKIGVRGIAVAFGRLAVVGVVFEFLVRLAGAAYNEIKNNTMNTVVGLVKMWRSGNINIAQLWFNMWRQTLASSQNMILKAVRGTLNSVLNMFIWVVNRIGSIFGNANLGDQLLGDLKKKGPLTKALESFTNFVRGDTNRMAEDMVKNSKKGTLGTIMNMNNMEKKGSNTTKKFSTNTKQGMVDAKLSMINQTKEGQQKGNNNTETFKSMGLKDFKDLNFGGKDSMKDLFKGTDLSLGKMKSGGLGSTGDLKKGGLKDFGDFNFGGNKNSDELKTGAMKKMWDMQNSVNKATRSTMEHGVKDLVDMQERGTGAMSDAQESWVSKAWATSTQTQQAFNAILEGLGRFIDKADIDMKKPEQFSVIYRKGGDISGGPNSPGLTPNQRRLATGGVQQFAAGGVQSPTGGVANGTTRVYGEVPGTTEFYITDNKRYRDRNIDILRQANEHMMASGGKAIFHDDHDGSYRKRGSGGEIVEAVRVPRGRINLTHGDHRLGMHGPMGGQAIGAASRGWKAPSVFESGRDARVYRKSGVGAARTTSGGTISVDPGFRGRMLDNILIHETGHALGLGHGRSGIMKPTIGVHARPSSAEIRWVHQNYETKVGGGGGHHKGGSGGGGSGAGSSDGGKKEDKLTKRERRKKTAKQNREDRRRARKFRRRFNRDRDNYGPLGEPRDYSRNAEWMAGGGINRTPATRQQVVGNFDKIAKDHQRHREQRPPTGVITEYLGATTHNWGEPAQSIQADTLKHINGITTNTYVGHPGGEGNSVDHWGPGGRGNRIGTSKGNEVESYILANHKKEMEYYIWQGIITGWGQSKQYNDKGDMHFDHLHATYPGGNPNLGGASGRSGSSGPSSEEINKWFEDAVPTMPDNLGYGMLGEAASMMGTEARRVAKAKYMAKVPTGSISGKKGSAEGMKIIDAAKAAGWEGSDAERISAIAYRESGLWEDASPQHPPPFGYYHDSNFASGDPSIGLIQMIGSYAKSVWGGSLNSAQNRLMLGLDNLGLAKQLHSKEGWGPWTTAGYRNEKGHLDDKVKRSSNAKGGIVQYSHGGVVTKPHFGLIGDSGPEVNLPLDDPRALTMLRNAFDSSSKVTSSGMQRATQKAMRANLKRESDELRGNGVVNSMQRSGEADYGERLEAAIREQTEDIVKAVMSEMEISDNAAEKYARMGMKLMREVMESPGGGKIVNRHIAEDVEYNIELKKGR